ncbi:MAG: ATP-binding protein [Gemmataceae bacterium]
MTTASDTIRKLILAHLQGDEGAFRAAAWEVVEQERRVNRSVLANELERVLTEANVQPPQRRGVMAPVANGSLPRDKDRNAPLIEMVETRRELADLVLAPSVREPLERIVGEWRKADVLQAHGLRPVSKALFHGPPGCGKTVAAEALARELYLPLGTVRFDAVVSSFLGETASNLRKVFEFARSRRMVLLFDEFDAIGKERAAADEHGELKRVVSSFLQLLDGFRAETLVLAATNHEGLLDNALWRRFDEVVSFPRPSQEEVETLLTRHLRQVTVARSVRLGEVARGLCGASHADVERVAIDAIKLMILAGQEQVDPGMIQTALSRHQHRRHQSGDTQPTSEEPPGRAPKPRSRRRRGE